MFRFIVVLAEIALLVMLLRSSFAQYLLEDIQTSVTELMTDISLQLEQTQISDLRASLAPLTASMRDFQKDYLLEVTESSATIQEFHQKYCISKEINPYVNGANLSYVCHAIGKTKLLENDTAS